ncbi:hypothetical protein SEVIR_4G058850v4 [Setaria viridis]|uniref:Uncharacterized protein n=1 Tax=Setaria italica TaxID=4555 RepID=K3Y099_SETIT
MHPSSPSYSPHSPSRPPVQCALHWPSGVVQSMTPAARRPPANSGRSRPRARQNPKPPAAPAALTRRKRRNPRAGATAAGAWQAGPCARGGSGGIGIPDRSG